MRNLSVTKHKGAKWFFLAVPALCIVFLSALFAVPGFGGEAAPQTVPFSSIAILKNLSRENKYFTINDTVRIDGHYYRFNIKSPHGEYDVLSTRDVFKTCHEIRVIEEYRATKEGGEAWNAAGESLKNIGRGAKQIVKEPKESAKAFARAGGKLMRSIGRFFKKQGDDKPEEKAGDGVDRDKGGEGFFVGKHARQFAAEVGLDVYTDNPYAQTLIQQVAKARSHGSIGTSVGLFFLAPVQGLGLLSNALTPNGFDAETEKLICEEAPDELRYVLTGKYKAELGIECNDGSPIKALLDNPNYSPREQAYLYCYFRRLAKPETGDGVEGFPGVIEHLGKIKQPVAATFAVNQMELLLAYQKYEKNLTRLITAANVIGGMTGRQDQLFIVPYDMTGNTSEMKDFLADLAKSAKSQGANGTQLWLVGDAMSDFISEAKSRGITVKKNALLLPHFAPGDTAKKGE